MTRTALPFSAPDLSALARYLERTLADHQVTHGRLPGHVEMMNVLARSIGRRNLQALQAEDAARTTGGSEPAAASAPDAWFDAGMPPPAASAGKPAEPALTPHAVKALQHFDTAGRLVRWPIKLSVQRLALWVLWTRFDARRTYTEAEVNAVLRAWHLYGDHATLRRELIDHRLMTRRSDCSAYRKLPIQPDPEALALLQAVRARARQHGGRAIAAARPARPASPPAASTAA